MMKKNLFLLLVLAVLLGAAVFYKNYWLVKQQSAGEAVNFLIGADIKTADKLIIKRGAKQTTLVKAGERWRVAEDGEWYVNQLLIDNLQTAWQAAVAGKLFLVSEVKDRQTEFQTDGSRLQVTWSAGDKTLLDLAIGLKRAGYTYVALAGDNKTYEAVGDLLSVFDYEEWRDFKMFNFTASEASEIKISRGAQNQIFKKDKDKWILAGNEKKDINDKVAAGLSRLSVLSADEIPDQTVKDSGLDKPTMTIEVKVGDKTYGLRLGRAKDNLLFAQIGDSQNIYLVDKTVAEAWQF